MDDSLKWLNINYYTTFSQFLSSLFSRYFNVYDLRLVDLSILCVLIPYKQHNMVYFLRFFKVNFLLLFPVRKQTQMAVWNLFYKNWKKNIWNDF